MLKHYKALSLCAAAAMTALSLFAATPSVARSRAVVVTAQRSSDLPTRRVAYRDLNLASATDQRMLERRVSLAVKQVCRASEQYANPSLGTRTLYLQCSDFAWGGARPQLAAAIDRAQALALNGHGAVAVGSLAIAISAPAGF